MEKTTRIAHVLGEGTFKVPLHISRVDSFKRSETTGRLCLGWHGWQVRWPGHGKFFSDAKFGSCASSLRAATRYTKANYPGKQTQCDLKAGVRVVWRTKPTKTVAECYVEVSHPVRSKAARRLYVGTENTTTAKRLKQKLKEAKKLRMEIVAQHMARTNAIPREKAIARASRRRRP